MYLTAILHKAIDMIASNNIKTNLKLMDNLEMMI